MEVRRYVHMHPFGWLAGTIVYNKVPGRRALQILIELLPGQAVCCAQSLETSGFARNKPFGQVSSWASCLAPQSRAGSRQ